MPGAGNDGCRGFLYGIVWRKYKGAVLLSGGTAFLCPAAEAKRQAALAAGVFMPGAPVWPEETAGAGVGFGSGVFYAAYGQSACRSEEKTGESAFCLGPFAFLALRFACGPFESGAVYGAAAGVRTVAPPHERAAALDILFAFPGIDFFQQL